MPEFIKTRESFFAAMVCFSKQDSHTQSVLMRCKLDPIRWFDTANQAVQASWAAEEHHTGTTRRSLSELSFAWEFEHATVIGGMDILQWSKAQRFGSLQNVRAVTLDDPYDSLRSMVIHHENSPWMKAWRQRDGLKAILPKAFRSAVAFARKSTFARFSAAVVGGSYHNKLQYVAAIAVKSLREMAADGKVVIHRDEAPAAEFAGSEGRMMEWTSQITPEARFTGLEVAVRSKRYTLKTFWQACRGKDVQPVVGTKKQQAKLF